MPKYIIFVFVIVLFVGCNADDTMKVIDDESELDFDATEVGLELDLGIDSSNVDEITIRTTMTEVHPSVKVISHHEDIENLINELNNLEGESIEDDHSKGWQYWILFKGYDISVMGNRLEVNSVVYEIDSLFYTRLKDIFENSIGEVIKYP